MTNNSLSEDIYAVGQLMADNLNSVGVSDADVDDGLTTLAGKILNASGGKTNTILTLNTPMVVYTDLFTVTGTLTDDEENPISEATVQLIWNDGTEHIATGTTDNDGVFSFTSTDPASVSAYSFQLFFAGDSNYNTSSSSVVNVDTAKETSVLVVTSPASDSTVSTDSVTISGTLKDNDGTPLAGKTIRPYINSSYSSANAIQVGSDGSFSKSISGLSVGRNTVNLKFINQTEYTNSTQSLVITRTTFDGLADLELIDGSQILSYADEQQTPGSQYATLETQLMNGDSPATIAGVTVEFWDFTDESAPYFLTSDETDSDGKVSFTYPSRGVGDVPIKAVVGSILTKTYTIEDCRYANDMTSADNTHWTIPSSANATYSSDGMKIQGSSWSDCYLEIALDKPMEIDVNITSYSSTNNAPPVSTYMYDASNKDRKHHIYYEIGGRKLVNDYYNSQANALSDFNLPSAFNLKIKFKSDSVEAYINGTLCVIKSNYNLVSPFIFGVSTGINRSTTYKNLKVKPL